WCADQILALNRKLFICGGGIQDTSKFHSRSEMSSTDYAFKTCGPTVAPILQIRRPSGYNQEPTKLGQGG
ncbi:MAG: hypothetical protein ACHP8A_20770, partial [Terriglobales bacterium]